DAAAWHRPDKALLLQDRQCLAHRRATHAERLHQFPLIESQGLTLAVYVGAGDGVLEQGVRLIAQAHRVERREREPPRGSVLSQERRDRPHSAPWFSSGFAHPSGSCAPYSINIPER